jgi:hypothetical protein
MKNALVVLPDAIGKKVKPPMNHAQMVEGMVEIKVWAFYEAEAKLKEDHQIASDTAKAHIARCIARLDLNKLVEAASIPSVFLKELGQVNLGFSGDVLDKAAADAVRKVDGINEQMKAYRSQNGVSCWWGDAVVRKEFRKQVIAAMKKKAGTDTDRVQALIKKPAIRLAFENALALLEGRPVQEAIAA